MEIETWADLKEFANQLDENQLSKPVIWWGEAKGGQIVKAYTLKEDYVNPSGESCEPISGYANDPDYDVDDLDIVLTKAHPIIEEKI